MKIINIALIPKTERRNLLHMKNHEGIFFIHKFRSLLMRMLLNDEYDTIDEFVSDSNVAGRKGRSIWDHLFIVNGVIHDHHSSETKPVTFQIMDVKLYFDYMWYKEVTNDLFEAGVNDDKLALLAKINDSNNIAVKTPVGLTKRKNIKKIICEGDPWGGIEWVVRLIATKHFAIYKNNKRHNAIPTQRHSDTTPFRHNAIPTQRHSDTTPL